MFTNLIYFYFYANLVFSFTYVKAAFMLIREKNEKNILYPNH